MGDDIGVTGITIKSTLPEQDRETLSVNGVFIAIGHLPNTHIFKDQLDMSDGYINVYSGFDNRETLTNIPGVFAAGDVSDNHYRQAITSAGTGCKAALDVEQYFARLDA